MGNQRGAVLNAVAIFREDRLHGSAQRLLPVVIENNQSLQEFNALAEIDVEGIKFQLDIKIMIQPLPLFLRVVIRVDLVEQGHARLHGPLQNFHFSLV